MIGFHRSPASVETYRIGLSLPPAYRIVGRCGSRAMACAEKSTRPPRRRHDLPALTVLKTSKSLTEYNVEGLRGSITRESTESVSSPWLAGCQVFPASMLFSTPPSSTPMYNVAGDFGLTAIVRIVRLVSEGAGAHGAAPSNDVRRPVWNVPTRIEVALVGSTAIAMTVTPVNPAFSLRQLSPPSVLSSTPPWRDPMTSVPGEVGTTASRSVRPDPVVACFHVTPPSIVVAAPRLVAA